MVIKVFKSLEYHFVFDMSNGFFARWGKNKEDDPEFSPFGPEILDLELSTICHRGCKFCYKSNMAQGKNMSFDTFKIIFDKFPKQLTQIAFGVGDIDANPDLWKIMDYCREKGVIPNITINGERMTSELYDKLSRVCGAVAVSLYNKNTCYGAVQELISRGMKQVNIHCLLAHENYSNCLEVLSDRATDKQLEGLNAVVYLCLKPKGKRNTFGMVSREDFKTLINKAVATKLPFGFDSCTASNFLKAVQYKPNFEQYKIMSEPCESTLFSYFVNVDGIGFPCSFADEKYGGVSIIRCKDFIKDVWDHQETKQFRMNVMINKDENGCRMCPIYNLEMEE